MFARIFISVPYCPPLNPALYPGIFQSCLYLPVHHILYRTMLSRQTGFASVSITPLLEYQSIKPPRPPQAMHIRFPVRDGIKMGPG